MASIYSKQLFLGTVASGGGGAIYTVPANTIAIIRSIRLLPFGGGTPWTIFWEINSVFFSYASIAASTDVYEWEGRMVLNAGDVLKLNTATGGWAGIVSGYELTP